MSFEPKILGFLCQNSADLCADFAGMELKNYTPNFLPVKLPCLGSLDIFFLLKAYFSGADGVLILGCPPGHCRHKMGNERAKRRAQIVQSLLEILGMGSDRLNFACVHPSETARWVEVVNSFNERLTKLGPSLFLQSDLAFEDQGKFFWMNQFKKCDHCHQCKEVCPVCFCKKCYPESLPNFGIGWLIHVIERCTNCGACKDACPQGIRLFEIVQLLQPPHPILLPRGEREKGEGGLILTK
jgi:coenzyme F420-reducing hydrogenase delta subunit